MMELELSETFSLKPINYMRHGDWCVRFQRETYVMSYGDEQQFKINCGSDGSIYLDWLRLRIEKDPKSCLHLWKGHEIVGQLELGMSRFDAKKGFIHFFYLAPEIRGQGMSALLEAYTQKYFARLDIDVVQVSISEKNLKTLPYFQNHGWNYESPRPDRAGFSLYQKTY
jgi:hypothetical protein